MAKPTNVHTSTPIPSFGCSFGSDPEAFLRNDKGRIVPSFEVIPENGWVAGTAGKIVRDGVQIELQPRSSTCRQEQAWYTAFLLNYLDKNLPKGVSISFEGNVHIPNKQFLGLDPSCRRLLCGPSYNIYGPTSIMVNPDTYRRRSAGGHLHFGLLPDTIKDIGPDGIKVPTPFAVLVVKFLDAFVGNLSVLLDRDPLARTRRRVYGRAGEYRLPAQGRLEYRTLSNFWLKAIPLQSLMLAMGRLAIGAALANNSRYALQRWDAEKELFLDLDLRKVRQAINENNFELALQNWQIVEDFLKRHNTSGAGVNSYNSHYVRRLIQLVQEHGLDYALLLGDAEMSGVAHYQRKPLTPTTKWNTLEHWFQRASSVGWAGNVRGFEYWIEGFTPPMPAAATA